MRGKVLLSMVAGFSLTVAGVLFRSEDYKGWNHIKSMVIYSKEHPLYNPFGGIHHVYANDVALKAVRSGEGRKFPDGSVLVFLLYEAKNSGGAFVEGSKKQGAGDFMPMTAREGALSGT